ncbi:MAG: sphingomyelin phosphodiesterase, partial [Planctomycetota bacterium]|nr:sphingomyelin phosphodiesterase [Planctomycetota bacterium]
MRKAMVFMGVLSLALLSSGAVIAQDEEDAAGGKRDTLSVLAYNIYMRPTLLFKDKQMERAKHIVKRLNKTHDVIVFSEAFDDKVRAYLVKNMTGYPYKSRVLGRRATVGKQKRLPNLKNGQINGGVLILSRYPIVKEVHKIYSASLFPDSLAAKGVLQASIKKNGRLYHIFGTHLQAGMKSSGGSEVRFKQVQDIQSLIAKGGFSEDDAVIVAGDLNMNLFSRKMRAGKETEAQRMLKALSMVVAPLK